MAHASVDKSHDRIVVTTVWTERELVKMVPGARWDPDLKHWHMPLTWASCIILRGVFAEALTVDDELMNWAWPKRVRADKLEDMRQLTVPSAAMDLDDRLYPFQRVGADFVALAEECILADEMGTGKTIQALTSLDDLEANRRGNSFLERAFPALVVCPNSVKSHWAEKVVEWTEFGAPFVVAGSAAQRKKIIESAATHPYAVIIVNFESTRLLSRLAPYGSVRLRRCRECDKKNGEATLRPTGCEVHPKELNRVHFKTVIIDEAHRIKNPQSKQTRAVWALAHQSTVVYRWALTGTPLANHPGDLWSIFHAISPHEFPTRGSYVDRYCLQSWNAFGGLDIVGLNPAHREEFYRLLNPRFRRMPKELVLSQLPKKVRSTRWVDMTPAQAKLYKQADGIAITIGNELLDTSDPLIARIRKMQLASSMIALNGRAVEVVEPSPKLDELEIVLEELGDKPVVICAEQRKLIELAARRLDKIKRSYGLITGNIPEYERQITLEKFQNSELQTLLFTMKAGGTGLTMTAADTIIFLQRSDSMIDNKQAEDRVHRIGSEVHESIHIIDIVCRDTVEEPQIASLTEKFMRLQEIARDRETLFRAGHTTETLDAEEATIMGMKL